MKLLVQFLQLSLLIRSCVRTEKITVAWNSSNLEYKAFFTVQLGDEIIFHPCGVSQGTNVVYTNSEAVFEDCIPRRNVSSEAIYRNVTYIQVGDCVNSAGQPRLSLNTETVRVDEVFYLLSDYLSECHDGVKAVVKVVPPLPNTAIPGPAVDPTSTSGKSEEEPPAFAEWNTVILGREFEPAPTVENNDDSMDSLSVTEIIDIGATAVIGLMCILICVLLCKTCSSACVAATAE